jgi:hypothetical protein
MKPISLKFAGKIVDHLSVTIPSNIFALNELTKNSYDAFATEIEIVIDIPNSKLIIKDNGIGMNESDITKLFYIGNSTKTYGKKNSYNALDRYVQGSKGLGFLSSFKFGDIVKWETNKEGKKIEFLANKEDIISKQDASEYNIYPKVTDSNDIGTTITIDLDNKKLDALCNYFQEEKNITKTVNAFYDQNITLTLKMLNNNFSSKSVLSFLDEGENYQFCYVTYDSSNSNLKIYRDQREFQKEKFKISSKDYIIKAELMIYHFKQGKNKKSTNISKLFYRDDDALTPLLYINDNLFNNYKYFDSNINRSKRSAESMPQMIGYVRVYCSEPGLEFNSDRTNFVESDLTSNIINDLKELNSKIQKLAASIKEQEKDKNTNKISTGRAFPKVDETKVDETKVDETKVDETKVDETKVDETKVDETKVVSEIKTAKINLAVEEERKFYIPSKQINLRDYVTSVTNSSEEKVDLKELNFLIDNKKSSTNIIPSINEPCEKQILINYNDKVTGLVSEQFKLSFIAPEATIKTEGEKQLFTIFSNQSYTIKIPYASCLINQLEKLYSGKKSDYYELIACALRAILEISVDYLKQNFPHIFTHQSPEDKEVKNDKFLWKIVQVIHFIQSHNQLITWITNELNIDFHSFKNHLNIDSYSKLVKLAHLGAHKSNVYLTDDDIPGLAKRVGHFTVICDVMLYKIDKSNINSLNPIPFKN